MTIDLSFLEPGNFSNPFSVTWFLVTHGGWVVILIAVLRGLWWGWIEYIQEKYQQSIEYAILAIDVPKNTEQTPKAVESIFSHIHGIQKKGTLVKRYLHGFKTPSISFELISIGGYIQFLVRTPTKYRDLIESAFYAQYPDAEISEVEDYTDQYPVTFPNEEYDLWGADIKLTKKDYFPIRTYPAFEHVMTQQLLDPMASLLEYMSRLSPGEQLWIQVLVKPSVDEEWRKRALKYIRKLAHSNIGSEKGGGVSSLFGWLPKNVAQGLAEVASFDYLSTGESGETEKKVPPSLMTFLTPDEKAIIEAISYKTAKLYFYSKLRIIYLGDKAVFQKDRVPAFIGALKQFNTLDTNGFKVDKKTKTSVDYIRKEQRQNYRKRKILRSFKGRKMDIGTTPYILNIEELASVYHFPVVTVKAPLVQKTEAKKAEPPMSLPIDQTPEPITPGAQKTIHKKDGSLNNLLDQ